METKLKSHLCETKLGWIGLVLSPNGLRATTLPLPTRDDALRQVAEMGALEPATEAEAGDLPAACRPSPTAALSI